MVLLEKQGATTPVTYTCGNSLICNSDEVPLFDGLGSERTVTNSSQAVTASLTLSAFGQTVASTGSSTSAYQFGATSGYRSEGDAGLTLVGCRFYDAQVGRFITRDTYLDQAPYAYCDGDPVDAMDPSGHNPQKPGPKPPAWPWQWGKGDITIEVNIDVGVDKVIKVGGGIKTTIPINGPEYWSHMPPIDRSKTHTFVQFEKYVIKHLHTSAN